MKTHTCLSSAVLLLLGAAISPFAGAAQVIAKGETASIDVPVGPADVEFLTESVTVRGPRTLVIHYFAECQVERGHIEYDITVHRANMPGPHKVVPPTNDILSALCSNDGDTTESNMRAKSVGTVVACSLMTAGTYNVRIRGHVEALTMPAPGKVDDQSLIIEEHELSTDIDMPACVFEPPVGSGSGG